MSPGDLAQPSPLASGPPDPSNPCFRLVARTVDHGYRELKVEGELDLAVADQLRKAIAGAAGGPVLIDMSECTFLDSTGLAVVLLARREGERVVMHSPSAQVLRILSQVGLTGDGVVFDDRDEAISGVVGRDGDA